jgi:hypothetical protein
MTEETHESLVLGLFSWQYWGLNSGTYHFSHISSPFCLNFSGRALCVCLGSASDPSSYLCLPLSHDHRGALPRPALYLAFFQQLDILLMH